MTQELTLLTIVAPILYMLVFFLILGGLYEMIMTKGKKARELFADLFIVGTIRKLAKEDGIDLDAELKEVIRMEKLERASTRSIDRTIEVELNEKISAKNQIAIDSLNKKG